MPKIVVLLGAVRDGRVSEGIAKYVASQLKQLGAEVKFVDAKDLVIGYDWKDTDLPGWMETAQWADGFVLVSPEYNHGYAPAIKLVLDGAYDEYEKKPVGFVGVSSGPFGGIRAVEQLRQVCVELGLVGIHEQLLVGFAAKTISPEGKLLDPSVQSRMEAFGKALVWWADGLKTLRQTL